MQPRDLFDQLYFSGDVGAEAWNSNAEVVVFHSEREACALQIIPDLRCGDVLTEQTCHALHAKTYRCGRCVLLSNVHRRADYNTAGNTSDELRRVLRQIGNRFAIHSALETVARVC